MQSFPYFHLLVIKHSALFFAHMKEGHNCDVFEVWTGLMEDFRGARLLDPFCHRPYCTVTLNSNLKPEINFNKRSKLFKSSGLHRKDDGCFFFFKHFLEKPIFCKLAE